MSTKYISEHFSQFSEEELLDIALSEDFSEDLQLGALISIQERLDLSEEELLEFLDKIAPYADKAAGVAKKAWDYAKENPGKVAGGLLGAYAIHKSGALKNAYNNIKDQMSLTSGSGKIMNMDQLLSGKKPDEKTKGSAATAEPSSGGNADKSDKPSIWKKGYDFIKRKIFKPPTTESISGELQMKKSFSQFKEELPLVVETEEQYFIEDLDNESLVYVIESNEYEEEIVFEAFSEFLKRNEVELSEELIEYISEGNWDNFKKWATTPVIGGSDPKAATKAVQRAVGTKADGKWGPKSAEAASKSPLISASALAKSAKKWATTPITQSPNKAFGILPNVKSSSSGNSGKPSGSSAPSAAKPTAPVKSGGMLNKTNAAAKDPKNLTMGTKAGTKAATPSAKPAQAAKPKAASSPFSKDLRDAAKNMLGATRGAAGAASNMANKMKAIPGTNRMNKPVSRGGQTSNQIHSAISKLGGEPTRPVSRPAAPTQRTASVPSKPMSGAPRASSSKPPTGGKWM